MTRSDALATTPREAVPEAAAPAQAVAKCGDKPLRADAARNRAKLVDVATVAFTDSGVDVSLDEIARTAGVGIGTLYRHFPTREDLVLAVYSTQVDSLVARSHELLEHHDPGEALHEWMRGFVDFYAVKMGLVNLLRSMMQDRQDTFAGTRACMLEAARRILEPAKAAGAVRDDVTAEEIVRALGGICLAAGTQDGQQTSLAIVDLVYDGLRFGAKAPATP